jgi:hypothetical protein
VRARARYDLPARRSSVRNTDDQSGEQAAHCDAKPHVIEPTPITWKWKSPLRGSSVAGL